MEYARCVCGQCNNGIEFPVEAAGETVGCPHCLAATELRVPVVVNPDCHDEFARDFLFIIALVVSAGLVIAGLWNAFIPTEIEDIYSKSSARLGAYAPHSYNRDYWQNVSTGDILLASKLAGQRHMRAVVFGVAGLVIGVVTFVLRGSKRRLSAEGKS